MKALETLITPDSHDNDNYYIGKHAIPRGKVAGHEDDALNKFQADMRKMGGSDMQLATLKAVREGALETSQHDLQAPPNDVAKQLLSQAREDRSGYHIGNLTVPKEAFEEFSHQLKSGNGRLLAEVEKDVNGKRETKLDENAIHKIENPAGAKLLAQAFDDGHGNVHLGHVTVPKWQMAELQRSLLADTPEANARVLRLDREANAVNGPDKIYDLGTDRDMQKPPNAEMQKVLSGIPDRDHGDLGTKNKMNNDYMRAKQEEKNRAEYHTPVSVNGQDKEGDLSVKGTFKEMRIDPKTNERTVVLQVGPGETVVKFPYMVDGKYSNSLDNLQTAKKDDIVTLDVRGNNTAVTIERDKEIVFDKRVGPEASKVFGEAYNTRVNHNMAPGEAGRNL